MADLSQTAASVKVGASTTRTQRVQYGETITQGQPLYLHTDGKYYKTDANVSAAAALAKGIALTPGVADDYGYMALPGTTSGESLVNLGATLTVGVVYAVSATAGAIAPVTDISSTQFVTVLGVAMTAALLDFQVASSSAAKA